MARILLLTPQLPYPPHQGTSLRNYHLLRALARGHEVSLLSFAEEELPDLSQLRTLCDVLPPVPVPTRTTGQRLRQLLTTGEPDMARRLHSTAFAESLSKALRETQYDFVQVEGIELAWSIDLIRAHSTAGIVLDCHNAETELQRRAFGRDWRSVSRWPAAAYSALQIGRLARFEGEALRAADAILAVSETDRRYLAQRLGEPEKAIAVIPNMIDVEEYRWPDPVAEALRFDVVFTGKMDYRPNVDAVLWFAEAIWPLIRRERPEARWAVVGQRPHPRLESLRQLDGVILTGRVPQVQPYLAGAGVYVMPLRIGSGTRLKLIESMAAGCAVVSTTIGAEGFPVVDGREIVLADTAEAFAAAVLKLLADPARRAELSRQAERFAARYDWRQQTPLLDALYALLMAARAQ